MKIEYCLPGLADWHAGQPGKRSRQTWSALCNLHELRRAAQALADDAEASAQCYRRPGQDTWPAEWEVEDPEGYRAWKAVKKALDVEL